MQAIPFLEYYPDGHMWPYMCGVKSSRRADECDIVACPQHYSNFNSLYSSGTLGQPLLIWGRGDTRPVCP